MVARCLKQKLWAAILDLSFRERVVAYHLPCVFQQPNVDMSPIVYLSIQDNFYWVAQVRTGDLHEKVSYKKKEIIEKLKHFAHFFI